MITPTNVKIQNTRGYGQRQGIKCLVYALSGYGKTRLCATAPNPFFISAEGGLLSLSQMTLPYVEIKTIADLVNVNQWCYNSNEAKQFGTLCIDSISEIAEVVLTNAKGMVKDPRQAYGELSEKMTGAIRSFRDIPNFNVVMTAKQEYFKDEVTGVTMNGPSMPGKSMTRDIPYFFDEVFQIGIGKLPNGKDYNFLRTQSDFNNMAKDRSGMLAPIEEPNLTKLFTKINAVA